MDADAKMQILKEAAAKGNKVAQHILDDREQGQSVPVLKETGFDNQFARMMDQRVRNQK
jgi:hypothetical protein